MATLIERASQIAERRPANAVLLAEIEGFIKQEVVDFVGCRASDVSVRLQFRSVRKQDGGYAKMLHIERIEVLAR